jgi:hypothetical protein
LASHRTAINSEAAKAPLSHNTRHGTLGAGRRIVTRSAASLQRLRIAAAGTIAEGRLRLNVTHTVVNSANRASQAAQPARCCRTPVSSSAGKHPAASKLIASCQGSQLGSGSFMVKLTFRTRVIPQNP